jgi:hypothetical protein
MEVQKCLHILRLVVGSLELELSHLMVFCVKSHYRETYIEVGLCPT